MNAMVQDRGAIALERRSSPRENRYYPLRIREFRRELYGNEHRGITVNVGEGGAYLVSRSMFEARRVISVRVSLPGGGERNVLGVVMRVDDEPLSPWRSEGYRGFGVRFLTEFD